MKRRRIIGRAVAGIFALSVIPYQIRKDDETGSVEVRSLLWGLKKTPGGEKDHFIFAIPASGLDNGTTPEADTPAEGPAEAEPSKAPIPE